MFELLNLRLVYFSDCGDFVNNFDILDYFNVVMIDNALLKQFGSALFTQGVNFDGALHFYKKEYFKFFHVTFLISALKLSPLTYIFASPKLSPISKSSTLWPPRLVTRFSNCLETSSYSPLFSIKNKVINSCRKSTDFLVQKPSWTFSLI